MKLPKSLAIAGLLAAGISTSASPNVTQFVHILGATAYRQNGNDTIPAIVNGFTGGGLTATSSSSSTTAAIESAKQNQWLIPNYATGINLEINVTWAGSTAGLASVASGSITQKYIADGTGAVGSVTTGATVGTAIQPYFNLGDTFQATS